MGTNWRTRLATFALDRGGALALCSLLVYGWLAPTTIVDGDNAEFATVGTLGGRAHPTGYPAFVMYLRLMRWLPGATPAHTTALATALLAALTILTLHAACRAWGARPGAATIACAMYAASPIVLRIHSEAEVFAPNALVAAVVLWVAAAKGPLRGVARGGVLGLVAGLGLANHVTCALVGPVGILGVVRAVRERRLAAVAALAGLMVGLSAYAYLVIADGPASFGKVDGLSDVISFVLRQDYGGPGAFQPGHAPAQPGENLVALGLTLGRAFLWLPALGALVALGLLVARPRGETRAGWITLAASFLLAGPVLAAQFNIEPTDVGHYIVSRFHLLPMTLLVVPVAAGFTMLAERTERLPKRRATVAALGVALFAALVLAGYPRVAAQHSPAIERAIVNTLHSLPQRAIVIGTGDDLCAGSRYVQLVLGERPDVDVVCWGALPWAWYRDDLHARGLSLAKETYAADLERMLGERPVYFTDDLDFAFPRDRSYIYGILTRVLPRGQQPPPLLEVFETNKQLFRAFDLHYPRPTSEDDWAAAEHRRYAQIWIAIANRLARAGHRDEATEALAFAGELFPEAVESAAR